jgi:hypothetical protein
MPDYLRAVFRQSLGRFASAANIFFVKRMYIGRVAPILIHENAKIAECIDFRFEILPVIFDLSVSSQVIRIIDRSSAIINLSMRSTESTAVRS